MRHINKYIYLLTGLLVTLLSSCHKETTVVGRKSSKPEVEIKIDILRDRTFYADSIYVLDRLISVDNNATLTIQPGSIIKMSDQQSALLIQRGAKIMAEGTADKPIIFTSADSLGLRHHGAWAGIFVCGKAPLTRFSDQSYQFEHEMSTAGMSLAIGGGEDPADNSGVMKYVRIEFASRSSQAGLVLIGVGTGTVLENIEVSYTTASGFGFFGGTVNAKNLVAFNNMSTGFVYTNGYTGRQQFLVSYKHPWFATDYPPYPLPTSIDGLYVSSDLYDYPVEYDNRPVISNLTVIGPYDNSGINPDRPWNAAVNIGGGSGSGSKLALRNSLLIGMLHGGIKITSDLAAQHLTDGSSEFSYNLVHSNRTEDAFTFDYNVYSIDMPTLQQLAADWHNQALASPADARLTDPFNYKKPGLMPMQNSPALTGADFSGVDFDSYFQQVPYRGAFGATDWMNGWTDFYPINNLY